MKSSGEHRRGRSMGSAPPAIVRSGEKDEDLALFHEMKRREKHNFLYPAPDDLDATLSSKFGGMGAPAKKPGTDLLTSESDKNDYDWLLTPPGTPLFPSLDQEAAALAVLSPALSNGSFSSASSASKSLKSSTYSPAESAKGSRGNPSPRRQASTSSTTPNGISRSRSSPGPAPTLTRPSTPTSTGGTRPSTPTSKSSTRSSTPNLKLTASHSSKSYSNVSTPTGTRPSTPTPRSSTPPVRPSTPGGRSSTPTSKPSTPTMRRSLSGGRTGITSPSPTTTRGGPSPKRTTSSRGNSPSAKRITSVITSIAGMSSEAPPNLRTTMPERSLSTGKTTHSNGSRIGMDNYNNTEDSAQSRRRPRSPSVARSFSSSSSQEQRTSSQTSRGSVVSSYDDGLEVNRPSQMGSGRNSGGKWHATGHEELLTGKPSAYANRAAKSPVTRRESSGYGGTPTKKSSDMARRPVDAYQNSPSTAYRHLHSNSPVSAFGSRTNSLLLRAGVGMNTSMTTSSNASSEHGTTVAADTEGSERDEDDLLSWDSYGRRASLSPRLQQADILVLDKDDEKTVPWQDSIFERANSHGPSSSHSQGSQSTLDAEVTGFYETDGIASLEMLEQLGVMGESYQLKKGNSFRSRSSDKRTTNAEDKVPVFGTDDYGHSRISPHKVLHDHQGSPARHLAHVEKQESLDPPRRSRDFDSKIPTHLVFQEGHGSPLRHLPNLVRPEEVSERPRKSRDFESRSSPRRLSLEGQGSPGRHVARLEKQESLERPRKSRDFDSKSSPRRLSLESQGSPTRGSVKLEKQEMLERPRNRDFDFEAELLRRNGEKLLGSFEPQAPNSEIRAACLFVRDFKVGLSPSQSVDTPQADSSGGRKLGIEEMEMKLRKELSYDWDNSLESLEPAMGSNGDLGRRYSDPPIFSRSKRNVATPESSARHSLDFPFTSADVVYPTKVKDSVVTPEATKEGDPVDSKKQELTDVKDVDLTHQLSMKNPVTENAYVNDTIMDESDGESIQPKEVDMDCQVPTEGIQPSAPIHGMLDLQKVAKQDFLPLESQVPSIQSDLSSDGVYAMDEDTTEMPNPEDGAPATQSEAESAVLEESMEDGHVPIMEEQHNSPMDVHEARTTMPEEYRVEGDKLSQGETHQEAARIEEMNTAQSSQKDAASADLHEMQSSGADHQQVVLMEEPEGMWYPSALPYTGVTNAPEVVEKEFLGGEDESEVTTVEADGMQERQIEQVVHSNSNYLNPKAEDVPVLEKESVSHHNLEAHLGNMTDNQISQELPEHSDMFGAVDAEESSQRNLYAYPDAVEENEKSALHESCDFRSVEHAQEDVPTPVAELEKTEDPVAEVIDIKATQGIVKEAAVCLSDQQQQQSSSQSLEYFDADSVATVDDTCDDASSKVSNHLLQEELQSLNYLHSDSQKDVHYLSDPKDDDGFLEIPSLETSHSDYLSDTKCGKGFLEKDVPSFQSSEESPEEDVSLCPDKRNEFDARCVENEPLPYGSAGDNMISSNCNTKAVQFIDKHSEGQHLFPSAEDVNELQQPKTEFRSASTLCAALEEQIAGLIQKIDSAIEESSKPFSASPQESLLVKDKRSILEPEQDDFTGSMRSSQEEDLLDMLWAEDDETSCSEGSRDQDILNSKDCSQREMNGIRSSRLSDRVLPVSLLGQSNGGYEAVVRSSRSDPGVEKRMLEVSSKRIALLPMDQQDDALMHNREPIESPILWSTELNLQHFGLRDSVPEDDHFHVEAKSNHDKSSGEGDQSIPDEELRSESFGQEYGSDTVTESSSYDEIDIKTDAELLLLCSVAEPVCDSDTSEAVSASTNPAGGQLETGDGDTTRSEESTRGPGESSRGAQVALPDEDAALENPSSEVSMSDIVSEDNPVTLEARDQPTLDSAHNSDSKEPSILLTLSHSEVWSKIGHEIPNHEWLSESSDLPEETSSRPVPSVDPVTEEHALELEKEPQSLKESDVPQVISEENSFPSLTSELVDPNLQTEETQGKGSLHVDHFMRDTDVDCLQESEGGRDINPLRRSPEHEMTSGQFSFGLGAEEDPESSSGRNIRDGHGANLMLATNGTSGSVLESTQIPESNSTVNGDQLPETNIDAEVEGENLLTPGAGAVESRGLDEVSSEAPVVHENKVVQSLESSPGDSSDASLEDVQIQRSDPVRSTDCWQGQLMPLNSGVRAERESFGMEANDSGSEPGGDQSSLLSGIAANTIVTENLNTEADVHPQEGQTRLNEEIGEGHQEVTRLSVLSTPAASFKSLETPPSCIEEMKPNEEDLGISTNGDLEARESSDSRMDTGTNGDLQTRDDEDSGVGIRTNGDLDTREDEDDRVRIRSNGDLETSEDKDSTFGTCTNGYLETREEKDSEWGIRTNGDLETIEDKDCRGVMRPNGDLESRLDEDSTVGIRTNGDLETREDEDSRGCIRTNGDLDSEQDKGSRIAINGHPDSREDDDERVGIPPNGDLDSREDKDSIVSTRTNGDLDSREDQDSRVGVKSVRRLPSNKAKSVRTISLSPRGRSQIESPPDEPSSPEEVGTPDKPGPYTNFEVISPGSLPCDRISPGNEIPTKVPSSPGSRSRNMTAAEATDSVLFPTSVMDTSVHNAAACADEEEIPAVSISPTSTAERPCKPELADVRGENNSGEGEAGNCKSQEVSTGPPSVRRALSYMGHQTVPLTPADTSLQIPEDQVIDMKALDATPPTATKGSPKDEVVPPKVSKAKCGCTIM